jgi:hypothetical protein
MLPPRPNRRNSVERCQRGERRAACLTNRGGALTASQQAGTLARAPLNRRPKLNQSLHRKGAEMPLVTIVVVLIVVGVLLWLINTYIPMDRKIKNILNAVVVIVVVIWLLQVFGLIGSLSNVRVR